MKGRSDTENWGLGAGRLFFLASQQDTTFFTKPILQVEKRGHQLWFVCLLVF